MFKNVASSCVTRRLYGSASVGLSFVACLLGCGSGVLQTAIPGGTTSATTSKTASQPILGYAMDASRTGFRAISGVPGASHLATGLIGSGSFGTAATCAQQGFALVTNSAGVYVMSLPSGQTSRLSDGISAAQRLLISPSCSYALLYAPDTSAGVLISGLPARR